MNTIAKAEVPGLTKAQNPIQMVAGRMAALQIGEGRSNIV
jgi:hypothetical protein